MTRRDMLRRGAIVGGTLLWVAPAIQSMAPKALAQARRQGPSPGTCAACYCFGGTHFDGNVNGPTRWDLGGNDGVNPIQGWFSSDDCENYCKWQAQYAGAGAFDGPYTGYQYCSGTATCGTTSTNNPASPGNAHCT